MPPALKFFYFAFLHARGGLLNDIDMYMFNNTHNGLHH